MTMLSSSNGFLRYQRRRLGDGDRSEDESSAEDDSFSSTGAAVSDSSPPHSRAASADQHRRPLSNGCARRLARSRRALRLDDYRASDSASSPDAPPPAGAAAPGHIGLTPDEPLYASLSPVSFAGGGTSTFARPPSAALSLQSSVSSPAELLYSEIRKQRAPLASRNEQQRVRKRVCFRDAVSLSSIKEISPVSAGKLDSPSAYDYEAVAPLPRRPPPPPPLRYRSPAKALPKTNPTATPTRSAPSAASGGRPAPGAWRTMERVSSYYDGGSDGDSSPSDEERCFDEGGGGRRPSGATAAVHRALAGLKSFGIKGELYITMVLNRGLLTITIDEGRHFAARGGQACNSYVRVCAKCEISRFQLSLMPDPERRTQCRTGLVPRTRQPVYNQTFTIELLPEDYEKRLLISVWNRDLATQKSALLGCMAFTVKHLIHTDKQVDGWYFLLSPSFGRHKHLAVEKVNMLTYYGSVDSGLQTSEGGSAQEDGSLTLRVPTGAYGLSRASDSSSECSSVPRHLHLSAARYGMTSTDTSTTGASTEPAVATSSSYGSSAYGFPGPGARHHLPPPAAASSRHGPRRSSSANQLDNPDLLKHIVLREAAVDGGSSSQRKVTFFAAHGSEPSSSGGSQPLTPGSDAPASLLDVVGARLTHTQLEPADEMRRARSFSGRRVASVENVLVDDFERKSSAQDIGRAAKKAALRSSKQHAANTESVLGGAKKRSFVAPIAKKLSFLRRREEARGSSKLSRATIELWASSFENLLHDKDGLSLFRTFLQREFSDENIDFWIACQEFKQLKENKLTDRAGEIFREFVAVQSPKEVNLDSDTRCATEANICSSDRSMFDTAQHRIEHLMEKDSYPRFLKSDLYLNLLNNCKK